MARPAGTSPPGQRRPLVGVFAVGLIAIAAAGLLLGNWPGGTSGAGPTDTIRGSLGPSGLAIVASLPTASPPPSGSPESLTGYAWPLAGAQVTLPFGPSGFGEWIVDGQPFHDGVDMATWCGDRVLAAHDGVVLAASRHYDDYMGWDGSLQPYYDWLNRHNYWNSLPIVIVIDDGDGYRSIYAHEASVTVKPGQKVKRGDLIGYEGLSGQDTGCHVHFGLFSPANEEVIALDPAIVVKDHMPTGEIARIDPLLVLPFRCEVDEMRAMRPAEASHCVVAPTFQPTPRATATKKPGPAPTSTSTGPTIIGG